MVTIILGGILAIVLFNAIAGFLAIALFPMLGFTNKITMDDIFYSSYPAALTAAGMAVGAFLVQFFNGIKNFNGAWTISAITAGIAYFVVFLILLRMHAGRNTRS